MGGAAQGRGVGCLGFRVVGCWWRTLQVKQESLMGEAGVAGVNTLLWRGRERFPLRM